MWLLGQVSAPGSVLLATMIGASHTAVQRTSDDAHTSEVANSRKWGAPSSTEEVWEGGVALSVLHAEPGAEWLMIVHPGCVMVLPVRPVAFSEEASDSALTALHWQKHAGLQTGQARAVQSGQQYSLQDQHALFPH